MAAKVEVPKAPPCEECGDGALFHELTYYTIVIDELFAQVVPQIGGTGILGRFINSVERRLTPGLFRLFIKMGVAEALSEPDDDTQLLALMIWNEAKERGIEVREIRILGLPRNIFLARLPGGRHIAFEGIPLPISEYARVPWMDEKDMLKKKFRALGFPVADGGAASSFKEAQRIYSRLTPPVIVKPFSGSGSRHTTMHITDYTELARAFAVGKQVAPRVVIEEELVGPVYRATVVDGKLAAVLRRDQPYVIGDGKRTVKELVEEANTHPKRQGPYFHHIKLDAAADKELAYLGYTPDSVLPVGSRANLHPKINWSVGGTTADVTDEVHPENVRLFEDVARALKAPIAGIDFIIEDIRRSWRDQHRCGILECNSMPFFDNHHLPFEGKPRNVAARIWDMTLSALH